MMAQKSRTDLVLAGSAGGHLDLLLAIAPSLPGADEALWVTSQTPRGESLRGDRHLALLPEYGRDPRAALRNLRRAAGLMRRHRPRIVVTTGAGLTVPLCLCARLSGARLIFIETMARVSSPSRTARLLSRIAARTIVQWPELAAALPRATVCAPLLLEGIPEGKRADGTGTFVAVGTHAQGFGRLLEMVRRAAEEGVLPTPVWAQTGATNVAHSGLAGRDYLPAQALRAQLETAKVVVCHGGAGIISVSLRSGRTPILVPRRAHHGEHLDDHQLQLADRLARWGLVVVAEDRITTAMVARCAEPLAMPAELRATRGIAEVLQEEL